MDENALKALAVDVDVFEYATFAKGIDSLGVGSVMNQCKEFAMRFSDLTDHQFSICAKGACPELVEVRQYIDFFVDIDLGPLIGGHNSVTLRKIGETLYRITNAAIQSRIDISQSSDNEGNVICTLKTTGYSVSIQSGDGLLFFPTWQLDKEIAACGCIYPIGADLNADMVFERYRKLPQAVKDLYFTNQDDEAEDMPFALVKELLEFVSADGTWQQMKQISAREQKRKFNELLTDFVNRFVEHERFEKKLKLGTKAVVADPNGKTVKASHKGQAISQLCKPRKWVAKLRT